MLNVFSESAESILDLLGEDAFFDGSTVATKINIEHGVQLTGLGGEEATYRGDLVANRDVATMLKSIGPVAGKTFTQNGKTYKLEFLVEDNGVTCRYVILSER